jgi:hypothetical protein
MTHSLLSDQHKPTVVGSVEARVQHGTVLGEKAVDVEEVVNVEEVTIGNSAVTSTDLAITTASKRAWVDGTDFRSNKKARTDKVSICLFQHDLKCNVCKMMQLTPGTTEGQRIDAYFKPQHSGSGAHGDDHSHIPPSERADLPLANLSTPLTLPDGEGLTRSERLFTIATHTDVRSMALKADDEFFLFMDMRAEEKWASFNMTSHKWVTATQKYNARLEALNIKKNRPTVKKNPRALMDLLGQVEPKVSERIIKNNFVCKF